MKILDRFFPPAPVVVAKAAVEQLPPQRINPMAGEVGTSGLRHYQGIIQEEYHKRLRNRRLYFQDLREMRMNDAMVNSCLWPIEMLMRGVSWDVEPADDSAQAVADAEFVESCLKDMSHTWAAFTSEWLWMLTYGFKPFEIVYKQRRGPEQQDGKFRSNYSDGLYGWRKFAPRDPESIVRWIFDEDGGVSGLVQEDPNTGKEYEPLPISRMLLFTTTSNKNNPEGMSLLRGAYLSWYYKKHHAEMEAIEAERDATGMAKVFVDPGLFEKGREADLQVWVNRAASFRKDEFAGIVLPQLADEHGNRMYDVELMRSPGNGTIDKRKAIEAYNLEIAQALMMGWVLLGHSAVGSKALSEDQTDTTMTALAGWNQARADVLNMHAIPRLFSVNKWRRDAYPQFKPGRVRPIDIERITNALKNLAQAGFPIGADLDLENFVRREAGMPEAEEDARMEQVERSTSANILPQKQMDQEEEIVDDQAQ